MSCIVASHKDLYSTAAPRCEGCGAAIDLDDEDANVGSAFLFWARGDERRYEAHPLCAACGTAIGWKVFTRWIIEEEEG